MRSHLPLRVMHLRNITGHAGIYGAEQCILSWIDEMRRHGGVEFVAGCFARPGEGDSEFVRALQERGLPVEILAAGHHRSVATIARLADFMRRHRVSVLHTHENRSDILGYLAARRVGVPVVSTIHGYTRESWRTGIYAWMNRMFLRRASFARRICVSNAMRRHLVRRWGFPASTVTVHNGVGRPGPPREEGNVNLRAELGLGRRERLVGVVGRLSREKGQRLLLDAVPLVLAEQPHAVFLLVGDGPDRELLETQIRKMGLEDAARVLGYRREVPCILRNLDLLVIPSLTEGLPIILLEAMVRGIPVVASRVGGIPEVVIHGETGILVPPGDARCLARAISSVLARPERASEMAEEGEKRAREAFSLARTASAIRRIYEEVSLEAAARS